MGYLLAPNTLTTGVSQDFPIELIGACHEHYELTTGDF